MGGASSYVRAIREYREELANYEWIDARLNLGRIYGRLERYEDAIREFETALAKHPRSSLAAQQLGQAHEAMGNRREAIRAYERALEINPQNDEARGRLRSLSGRDE